jgi:hypothetical protein
MALRPLAAAGAERGIARELAFLGTVCRRDYRSAAGAGRAVVRLHPGTRGILWTQNGPADGTLTADRAV